jgi:hypothetical protein
MKTEDQIRDAIRTILDYLEKEGFGPQQQSQVLSRCIGGVVNRTRKASKKDLFTKVEG